MGLTQPSTLSMQDHRVESSHWLLQESKFRFTPAISTGRRNTLVKSFRRCSKV